MLAVPSSDSISKTSLTVRKQPGADYRRPIKVYDVTRDGEVVGTLQTWGVTWEVLDSQMCRVASHTTIRAAVRVASRVL